MEQQGYVVYRLGTDTTMAGYYQWNDHRFSFKVMARPGLSVTILEGCLSENGELQQAKGYSYRPLPDGRQEQLTTYDLTTHGDSTLVNQVHKGKLVKHAYRGRCMIMNAVGTPFLFFLPLLSQYAPAAVGEEKQNFHFVLQQRRPFVIRRLQPRLLEMGSNIMGYFTLQLNEQGQPVSIDGIGSSWNVSGTVHQQLDLDRLIEDFARREAIAPMAPLVQPAQTALKLKEALIEVRYAQPSKRGRQIFGAVVPYNRVWRTGANEPTTLTTTHPLDFDGNLLPAGNYSLFTIPGEKQWTFIVNAKTDMWGTDYDSRFNVLELKMVPRRLDRPLEQLQINLQANEQSALLVIAWDTLEVAIPFREAVR